MSAAHSLCDYETTNNSSVPYLHGIYICAVPHRSFSVTSDEKHISRFVLLFLDGLQLARRELFFDQHCQR